MVTCNDKSGGQIALSDNVARVNFSTGILVAGSSMHCQIMLQRLILVL